MKAIKAAVIQLNSGESVEDNLLTTTLLVKKAARKGAWLVVTPENTPYMGPAERKPSLAEPLNGPVCSLFASLAAELRIHLVLGSFPEKSENPAKCRNTSVLFGPSGEILAHYSKINLFDVDIPGEVTSLESETVEPGTGAVAVATKAGVIGFSICYDLRFPLHYNELRKKGAEILLAPSAFTAHTGKAHWEPLLRARAIENQCFVLAPAQSGSHGDLGLKETHGRSMIVGPWGEILAEVEGKGPGVAVADLDFEKMREIRKHMPVFRPV